MKSSAHLCFATPSKRKGRSSSSGSDYTPESKLCTLEDDCTTEEYKISNTGDNSNDLTTVYEKCEGKMAGKSDKNSLDENWASRISTQLEVVLNNQKEISHTLVKGKLNNSILEQKLDRAVTAAVKADSCSCMLEGR